MSNLYKAAKQALATLENPWEAGAEGVANAIFALRAALAEPVADELSGCVKTFFEDYLNIREESESGRIFAPIQISCCRAHKLEALGALLERMRVLSGAEPVVEYEES